MERKFFDRFGCIFKLCLFVLVLAGVVSADPLIHRSQNRYGPNVGHGLLMEGALPGGVQPPLHDYRFSFAWVEPLTTRPYYSKVGMLEQYFSFRFELLMSSFYGQMSAGLGLRALPFLEFGVAFRHMQYLGSNLEMGIDESTTPGISPSESWRGDYILDNAYNKLDFDYLQGFELIARLSFAYRYYYWETRAVFGFVDVESSQDGKSYDYHYRIPVFSRDYLINVVSDLAFPLHSTVWDLYLEGEYMQEGWYLGDEDKDPLWEVRMRGGFMWHIGGRKRRHSLLWDTGYVLRDSEFNPENWYDAVVMRLNWQYNHLFSVF